MATIWGAAVVQKWLFLPRESGVFQPKTKGLEKRINTRAKKLPPETAIGASSRGASSQIAFT